MQVDEVPLWKYVPQLSIDERNRRWRAVRQEMAIRGLDCLLVWESVGRMPNIRYLTHVASNGLVLFPLDGDPVLFGTFPHFIPGWKASQRWIGDIRNPPTPKSVVDELRARGLDRGTLGVVGYGGRQGRMVRQTIDYNVHTGIVRMLQDAKFEDASVLLEEVRLIKSGEEISFLEKAGENSYYMFEALKQEAAKPGARECDLVASMIDTLVRHGGEYIGNEPMILIDSGNPPMLGLGGRGSPATTRKLEKGDAIITEYHGNYGGYLHATEHSFSVGKPRGEYLEIERVCEEVFNAEVESLKPGATLEEVERAIRAPVRKAGMMYAECGIHGHGLSSPELPTFVYGPPSECLYGTEYSLVAKVLPLEIKENMVFGMNIDICDPKWDKRAGLMLGDTLVVTSNGARKLSRIPVELTVV